MDVIAHPCPNPNISLAKSPFMSGMDKNLSRVQEPSAGLVQEGCQSV